MGQTLAIQDRASLSEAIICGMSGNYKEERGAQSLDRGRTTEYVSTSIPGPRAAVRQGFITHIRE